jgi:general secretion pathway protein C
MSTARAPLPFHPAALFALACAGLLAARTVNAVLELSLAPLALPLQRAPRAPAAPAEPPALSAERLAGLTGLTLGEASGVEPQTLFPDPNGELPTARGLRLLGTAISSRAEASFASIHEERSRRVRTVWPGSQLGGAEVVSIERTRVLLRTAERLEQLPLGPAAPATPPTTPASAPPALGAGIREVGPDAYTLPREELQHALAHPEQLMTQARIVPVFNGIGGFRVVGIRPDSLFARLGLRQGDMVQRLNGLELRGVESALEALARLREGSHFQLELLRDGQPVKKEYSVRD